VAVATNEVSRTWPTGVRPISGGLGSEFCIFCLCRTLRLPDDGIFARVSDARNEPSPQTAHKILLVKFNGEGDHVVREYSEQSPRKVRPELFLDWVRPAQNIEQAFPLETERWLSFT